MLLHISCSLSTFGNTPKVDTKPAMNENKIKNQKRSWCTIPPLSKEKEKEKHGIKLRESQVVLYVDQRDRDKQKSNDLGTN